MLSRLTDDFAISVLRAASLTLDYQLQHLDECWHMHAVHAACPEIISQGLLTLDCAEHSYSAASSALIVFSKHASHQGLCLLRATLLADFSHVVSPRALQFSFSLDSALRCGLQNIHLDFSAISEQNYVVLMHALAKSSTLQSLHLELQELTDSSRTTLAGVLSQLTCLEALHVVVHETSRLSEEAEQRTGQPSIHSPSIVQLRSLTQLTSLTLEGFCCGMQSPAEDLATCLAAMPNLQQLDVAPRFSKLSDVPLLASSISSLSRLSSLAVFVDNEDETSDMRHIDARVSELIPQSLASITSLRKLELCMAEVHARDDELKPLARAVQSLVCLESLSFEVLEAKTQSLAILEALSAPGRVLECTSLQLRASIYNSKDVDAVLCKRLCCLTSLQRLSLHMCIIQDNQQREAANGKDQPCQRVPILAALSGLTFLCMDSVIDRDGEEVPEPGAELAIDGFLTALGSATRLQHLQVLFNLCACFCPHAADGRPDDLYVVLCWPCV